MLIWYRPAQRNPSRQVRLQFPWCIRDCGEEMASAKFPLRNYRGGALGFVNANRHGASFRSNCGPTLSVIGPDKISVLRSNAAV